MAESPARDFDHHMMDIALAMARRGLGNTAPNPAVGAIIADEQRREIIARGWTQPGGRPHAETHAIDSAGQAARGCTMYVTLEPCSHHGRTGPCAQAIIEAGIARVVAAQADPDPRVSNRGFRMLQNAGIEVSKGLCAAKARELTLGHILRVTERRPLTQLKMAVGLDGRIARGSAGKATWVTSPHARAAGHLLRAHADAILVGKQTVIDDDPSLDCRLPGLAHTSPLRVVLANDPDALLESRLWDSGETGGGIVFCGQEFDPSASRCVGALSAGARNTRFVNVPRVAGRLWLPAIMEQLVAERVTRLLVEGGPSVWASFASAGLADEIVLFHARENNTPISNAAACRVVLHYASAESATKAKFQLVSRCSLEACDMFTFKRA